MKLPSGQPPPTISSGDGPASTASTTALPSAQKAGDAQLQKLLNTWVKVESSQLLSPEESRQALQTMQGKIRVNGQALPSQLKPVVTSPQEQSQPTTPAKTIDPSSLLKVPGKIAPTTSNTTPSQTTHSSTQLANTNNSTQTANTTTQASNTITQSTNATSPTANTSTQPANNSAQATNNSTQTTNTTSQAANTNNQSANTASQPTNAITQSANTTTQPTNNSTQSANTTTQPTSNSTQSASATTQATNNNTQTANTTTQSTSNSTQTANTTSQAANTNTQSANTTTQHTSNNTQSANSTTQATNNSTQTANTTSQAANTNSQSASATIPSTSNNTQATNTASQAANASTQSANTATQITNSATQSANPPIPPTGTSPTTQPLALLTLNSPQGTITILSTQLYDKGSQLLVQQNAQGQWQFQSPPKLMALSAINHQFNELKTMASALKLSALGSSLQSTGKIHGSAISQAISPPKSLLDATQTLDVKLIKQAIEQSGQFLEQKLLKASNEAFSQSKAPPTIDLNQRLKKVESQIQKWIDALPIKFSKTPTVSNNQQTHTQTPAQIKEGSAAAVSTLESTNLNNIQSSADGLKIPALSQPTPKENVNAGHNSSLDNKAWLIKLQLQLFKDWQTSSLNTSTAKDSLFKNQAPTNTYSHLQNSLSQYTKSISSLQPTPAAKPLINWFEGMAQQNQSSTSIHDTKTSNLLEWLLAPKAVPTDKALPIWPNNLSAQVQIHKLLQNLILQQPQASDSQEGPEKILRQLLQVSQSLTRIQHEQVNNRLSMQNQPDNLNLNFSVPYMHQQNINWCDLELSQKSAEDAHKKQSLGWHLVLRFAQDTEETFAIESYLNSDQLQLTLWAKQQEPLAKLHRHAGLLREKLTQAGFKVDSIQSKQGLPAKNQQQVHQSMVDVHT